MDAKDQPRRKTKTIRDVRYAECQLKNLNAKVEKLLNKLDEKEQDEAETPEEECVICVNSKATMQTWPCGHRVVCRRCLVRTIQMAVARRSLPLRCVVCRARVLRLQKRQSWSAAATDAYSPHPKSRRRPSVARSLSVRDTGETVGWAGGPFAADDADDADDDGGGRGSTAAYKCGKLDETDQRCINRSKNGLYKVLGVFKFWKFLRFKNNKPSRSSNSYD